MSNHIWVQVAGDDRRVPAEGLPGVYLEADKKHLLRNTPFLQRRIKEGDLIEVDAPAGDATVEGV